MALPSGFSTALSDPIGIRLVLLGLVVMPVAVLVLVFDIDGHRITPTTPTQDPPMLLPYAGKRKQQLQQRVLWMLTPAVLMPLLSNGADRHQQWEWSSAQ